VYSYSVGEAKPELCKLKLQARLEVIQDLATPGYSVHHANVEASLDNSILRSQGHEYLRVAKRNLNGSAHSCIRPGL